MNKRTKILDLHGPLNNYWRLDSHVEVTNEKKLFRIAIFEQGHFKLIEFLFLWRFIHIQFNLYKILFQMIIVLNFYQGDRLWLHVQLYYPCVPLIIVQNVLHGSGVRFAFILTSPFLWKVSYNLCISRITRKTIVDNIMS